MAERTPRKSGGRARKPARPPAKKARTTKPAQSRASQAKKTQQSRASKPKQTAQSRASKPKTAQSRASKARPAQSPARKARSTKPRSASPIEAPSKVRPGADVPRPTDEVRLSDIDLSRAPAMETPAPEAQRSGAARHLRRFFPLYGILAVFALLLVLFPTTRDDDGGPTQPAPATQGPAAQGGGGGGGSQGGGTGDGGRIDAISATGTTAGGFSCRTGVRQLPWSSYATQCTDEFSGSNGGETYRGVTADTILIARRNFAETANSQAVSAFGAAAGTAAPDVANAVRDTFIDYFNDTFELYGRRVVFEDFDANPTANATLEVQSRGKEGACVDATRVAQEIEAYAVLSGSGPFSECAAERGVVVMQGGAYFPETWYRQHDPFVWHQVMECERISFQVAEYIGKRLADRTATWAGSSAIQQQTRKFGTYVPNNDEYQSCVAVTERALQEQYDTPITSRYNYTLDISRFPEETVRAIVQFKAAGVTTIINADDPISMSFLTQAATAQDYRPEWFIIGVAAQDTDGVARLFDQSQVDGHLFGMSQLDELTRLWGPNAEPGQTYRRITGKDIPGGTTGDYFQLMQIFNFLQSAGPNLTPQTMGEGARALLPGGPPGYAIGYVSWADGPDGTPGAGDHTGVDDSREIYWCGSCTSPLDGKQGTYLETYDGRRFRNGEWPAEQPPVYPN